MFSVTAPTRVRRAFLRLSRRLGASAESATRPQAWSFPMPSGTYAGPGLVRSVDEAGQPTVLLSDSLASVVHPEWALPYRYLPAEGDVLMIIGRGDAHYVTGVLSGRGCSLLVAPVLAAAGQLRLSGDRGVRVVGPRVTLRAQVFEVGVRVLHEKVGSAVRAVRRLRERAGSASRVVEEDDHQVAGTRTIVSKGEVRVDGDLLQLG